MNQKTAFALFEEMIAVAARELLTFTRTQKVTVAWKPDKTVVTACDERIDRLLAEIARAHGIPVLSEEGEQAEAIVRGGRYLTIDPIDGTRCYLKYCEDAVVRGGIKCFQIGRAHV